jgi:hypothetical protein
LRDVDTSFTVRDDRLSCDNCSNDWLLIGAFRLKEPSSQDRNSVDHVARATT